MYRKPFRLSVGLAALTLALVLPFTAMAGHAAVSARQMLHPAHGPVTSIQFGQKGGNIRPWTVTINSDGTTQATGINARDPKLAFPSDTLAAMRKLATAERFSANPPTTLCPGTNPDIASRFITIQGSNQSQSRTVHGGCRPNFNQFFATLYAVADVTY